MTGTSLRLSDEFRASLGAASAAFQAHLSAECADYLAGRGLDHNFITRFQLGTVTDDVPGFADYAGMLCIPYVTPRGGTCALKFRRPHDCTESCEHSKYITPHETRLYNTSAFDRADELGYVAIAEGEFDAAVLTHYCGIPAVGVPGVETWTRHAEWSCLFRGYKRVLVFRDDDEPNKQGVRPGQEFARAVAKEIDMAEIIRLPGHDVNQTYLDWGSEQIRITAGV